MLVGFSLNVLASWSWSWLCSSGWDLRFVLLCPDSFSSAGAGEGASQDWWSVHCSAPPAATGKVKPGIILINLLGFGWLLFGFLGFFFLITTFIFDYCKGGDSWGTQEQTCRAAKQQSLISQPWDLDVPALQWHWTLMHWHWTLMQWHWTDAEVVDTDAVNLDTDAVALDSDAVALDWCSGIGLMQWHWTLMQWHWTLMQWHWTLMYFPGTQGRGFQAEPKQPKASQVFSTHCWELFVGAMEKWKGLLLNPLKLKNRRIGKRSVLTDWEATKQIVG